jgi:hypothetical protein
MADVFSTNVLMGVVASLLSPPMALLDRYFPTQFEDPSEEIHFDLIPGKRRIAPFVSPLVEGKVVDSLTHVAKTFIPAYIKDKRRFHPSRGLKRAIGERIGGSLSPDQRMQLAVATEMQDQIQMIQRRLEVMASEALRLGKNTVVGDGYPSTVVDYGRAAGNTIADLTTTARWGDSADAPLDNLQDWGQITLQASGAFGVDVIMGVDAWKKFRSDTEVKDRLKQINSAGTNMSQAAAAVEGLQYMGTIDNINIFVYGGWYVDPATGTETAIWPTKSVWVGSTLVEGVRAFGAIQDEEIGLQAMPYAPKTWITKDPAVRWLMMQSAPLTVPTRPDATAYCANVVDA